MMNKFGQDLVQKDDLISFFEGLNNKREFLNEFLFMVMQSKPLEVDVVLAITESGLKKTYTPCVLLKKGVGNNVLEKIVSLPDSELRRSFILLANLFKVAYKRRFEIEKDDSQKWWYWDLSDESKVELVRKGLLPYPH